MAAALGAQEVERLDYSGASQLGRRKPSLLCRASPEQAHITYRPSTWTFRKTFYGVFELSLLRNARRGVVVFSCCQGARKK
jgi:hypothetical protein